MARLLTIEQVPEWLRFNRFVRTGYRPRAGAARTAATVLEWHNETMNVWTHLVPAVAFLLYAATLSPESTTATLRVSVASFVFIFTLSVVYHLFMPCPGSRGGYLKLLGCDVLGALLSITLSSFSFLWYGDRCASEATVFWSAATLIGSCAVVAWAVVASSMTAQQRLGLFGGHCLLRLGLTVMVLLPFARRTGDYRSLYAHTASFAVLGLGGAINVGRVPERWVSDVRALDFIGNSHNVWHLLCIASAWITTMGCFYDLDGWDAYPCRP